MGTAARGARGSSTSLAANATFGSVSMRTLTPRTARRGRLVGIAALLLAPGALASQRAEDASAWRPRPVVDTLALTLPCPDCEPRPRRASAAAAAAAVSILIPWSWNKFVGGKALANVGPKTWWDNISGRWEWDEDSFHINQWGHPYQGSLYFNSLRTNGYGFWTSAGAAWAGSFLWECCAETKRGSLNDMANTALGGTVLGEMLYRVSALTLDNAATGRGRAAREIAATIINPVRGFNRLARGQMNDHAANPEEWRAEWLQGVLDLGWIGLGSVSATGSTPASGAVMRLGLLYGDPIRDMPRRPFSAFAAAVDLTTLPNAGMFRVLARGSLGGTTLGDGAGATHVAAANLAFAFFQNPAYEFGAQTVMAGVLSRWRLAPGASLLTEAHVRGMVLGAVRTDSTAHPADRRSYDYGPGLGGELSASLFVRGRGTVRLDYTPMWLHTVSGTASNHVLQAAFAEARVELTPQLALGTSYFLARRRSTYPQLGVNTLTAPEVRVFTSAALPRWNY